LKTLNNLDFTNILNLIYTFIYSLIF